MTSPQSAPAPPPAARDPPEPAAVGRVGVGPDHKPAGKRVILEDDLVDDAGAGLPEADPVLLRRRGEEVVDFVVLGDRPLHVLGRAALRPDQMVAVKRAGNRHALLP